jgi:glutaminase
VAIEARPGVAVGPGPRARPRVERVRPEVDAERLDAERARLDPLTAYLQGIHERHRRTREGTVATYIPELGLADPDWFGIAAVTLDGQVLEVGDARIPFSIQSISKPLTYGVILDELGEDAVRARIGVEPTGDAFNAITLDADTGLPLNPMVNAGAICATGLVGAAGGRAPLDRLLDGFSRFAGRPVGVDAAVFASESATGHRNRAIGHLLRANGALDEDPDEVVERYFAQCAVSVTAIDLAVIAATLAGGGLNPVTGERALSSASTQAVLAVMTSCGMYDAAGEWLYGVGLPAKSGVSGGILLVVPGQLGIAVFSPPLDPTGNSVRGVRVCRDLVDGLGIHPLRDRGRRAGAIRSAYHLSQVGSKRRRDTQACATLERLGDRALVVELGGHVSFLAVQEIADRVKAHSSAAGSPSLVVLDVRRIDRIDTTVTELLGTLITELGRAGILVLMSGHPRSPEGRTDVDAVIGWAGPRALQRYDELDLALEAAEDHLLTDQVTGAPTTVPLVDQAFTAGIDAAALAILASHIERRSIARGSLVVQRGQAARELLLIERGEASVTVDLAGGGRRRLSALGPGQVLGEAALLDGGRRTADVRADSDVVVLALSSDAFEAILASDPRLASALLRNLLRSASATAARLSAEIATLAG